jgi:hypothetical protein
MRSWKLALGLAFLLGVGIWGLATLGHQPRSQGTGVKFPSFSKIAQTAADQGVIQPTGKPEFTATFTGSRLKKSVWATCYPAMDLPTGCTYFGSSEYQWYLPSQDRVSGGVLRLTAQRAPTAGKARNGRRHEYACRSGMVTTYPSFRFTFGYVQVSAKILPRPGLRPALWLAAANGASQPKIAMLLRAGRAQRIQGAAPEHARRRVAHHCLVLEEGSADLARGRQAGPHSPPADPSAADVLYC